MKKERIIVSGTLHDIAFTAYITEGERENMLGLTVFDDIGDFECMVFELDKDKQYTFHTKKMKFNIDIVELNEDQEIVKIHKNIPPGIPGISIQNASFVIEFKGGTCERFFIDTHDKVFIDDVEHRSAIGEHSFLSHNKKAEFEGIDPEAPDYDNTIPYVTKDWLSNPSYRDVTRKSIIDRLLRSHEEFDVHSPEPEPISKN